MRDEGKTWHKGGCHCGAVSFEVQAPVSVTITDCNCSICKMTGYQHLFATKDEFRLLSGGDNLITYTFGEHIAQHHFCKTCGIKSFYVPKSHPDGVSVNFRCLDPSGFENISFAPFDGQNWESNIDELRAKD